MENPSFTQELTEVPATETETIAHLAPILDVSLGNVNFIELPDLNIALEAMSNKIVVLLDSYHSGYECPKCKGGMKLNKITRCSCDPINFDVEKHNLPGTRNRHGAVCENCQGEYMSKRRTETITCPMCDGRGHTILIPDSAKSLPTTGVVLSIGPDVTKVKRHTRIIATPYSGVFLPMKGNALIKIYTENEPLCYLHNIRDDGEIIEEMVRGNDIIPLDTSKFVEHDTPLGDSNNA